MGLWPLLPALLLPLCGANLGIAPGLTEATRIKVQLIC